MTIGSDERLRLSKSNGKKAYIAMCRVSLLLFAFTLISEALSYGINYLLEHFSMQIEGFVSHIFVALGLGRQEAFVAAKSFLGTGAFYEFAEIAVSLLSMLVPTLIFAKLVKLTPDECFCTDGKMAKGAVSLFCFCQLLCLCASQFADGIYGFLFPDAAGASQGSVPTAGNDVYTLIISVIFTCVIVPFVEELIFRGIMFSYLRRYGLMFGVVASATLFGVAHASPVQSMYAFVFGIIAAFFVTVTGNIKTGVLFHMLNNLLNMAIVHFQSVLNENVFSVFYSLYNVLFLAAAFYGMYRFIVKDTLVDEFRERVAENDGSLEIKPGIFQILAFPFVLYILYYAASVVSGVLF